MDIVKYIDQELYSQIKQVIPILCVDVLVHRDDRFLLLLRRNEPAKGLWWTPGGRLLKGETLKDAAHRKAREELGVDVILEKQICVSEQLWETTQLHCPDVYYLATLPSHTEIKMDDQHDAYRWFSDTLGLHRYVADVVRDSGILTGGDK